MNPYEEWLPSLKKLIRDVSRIAPESEDEFLSLGARLQEYVAQAETMTDLAASIVQHTGGEGASAIEQADQVFQNTFTEIENCCAVFSQGISTIDDVASKLEGLSGFLGTLEGIAKYTRIMGVSIKIESARVGQEGKGFWDLAQEVTDLAVRIHENVTFFKERLKSSETLVYSSGAGMGKKKAEYESKFKAIWKRVTSLLEELTSSFEGSALASARISARSQEIHDMVGQVVMAMQFHDITRQQLEHVVEAIEEICSYLEEMPGDAGEENDWLVPAISLQISHLREISREVRSAGDGTLDGMREVARLSSEQMEDALGLASGGNLEAGDTIFDRLEKELDSIATVLSEAREFSSAMAEGMDAVSRSVEDMGRSINEIREVGARIKLSALNALAEATRTGDRGRALRVLAKELHLFSEGTGVTTDGVIEALNELSKTASAQEEFVLRMGEKQGEVRQLMEKTLSFSRDLGNEAAAVRNAARRLDESCGAMSDSIDKVVRSVTFPGRMTKGMDACAGVLSNLLKEGGFSPDVVSNGACDHEMFKKFASRYSMEREREIHNQVSMTATPVAGQGALLQDAGAASPPGGGAGMREGTSDENVLESFGEDSIELFGDENDEQGISPVQGGGDDELGENIELF